MRRLLDEAMRYLLASGCALLVDVSTLWFLTQVLAWQYLLAATASFMAGAVVAYVLSVTLVFTQHRLQDRRAEFLSFIAIGGVGLAVNTGVIFLGVQYLGLQVLFAKALAAGFTFVCNFILRRQLLFVRVASGTESTPYVQ